MRTCSIHLVVALRAEARPIVAGLGLERAQPDSGFPIYRRGHVALVVTGPGKINAAAGTAFLGAVGRGRRETVWVNLGIAGHAERPVGETLLASSVRDGGSGRVWRPSLPEIPPFPSEALRTLDRPDLGYEHEEMVDMEASGFFPIARRYSGLELVQVLKVISDNRRSGVRGLGARQVSRLVEGLLDPLELLISSLEAGAERRRKPGDGRAG